MVRRGEARGPQLPYRLAAGVMPVSRGWLVASAKIQGSTIAPEEPRIAANFLDVLDYKPAYQVITLFAPIGLYEGPAEGGRRCEREARRLLRMPRASTIASAPTRPALRGTTYAEAAKLSGGHLSPVRWPQLQRIAEVDEAIAPYWQRTVFEVHPELSFFQLGEDHPLRFPKRTQLGITERRKLLETRVPGVERIIDAVLPKITEMQLIDAAACLWTARRVVARAITRLPEEPEWDELGLRMELVR